MLNLTAYLGDSTALTVPLTWQGAAFTPGNDWALIFTAKYRLTDADASAVIQKASGAGIAVTTSTATVSLVPDDTSDMVECNLYFDIQAQHVTDDTVRTVALGRIALSRDATRELTTSIPVITTETPLPFGPIIPTQTGNSGKYLTTNGTALSWSVVSSDITSGPVTSSGGVSSIVDGAISVPKITGTKAQFQTAMTDDDFVTLAGTQTLTGAKTFGAVITGSLGFTTENGGYYTENGGFTSENGGFSTTTGTFQGDGSGLSNLNASSLATGTISADRIADASLSIAKTSGLQTALDAKLTKSTPTQSWVFEGDSWSAGTAQGNDRETFPYYINILSGNTATITNVATAGQTAQTMAGTFAAQVVPHLTATIGKPSIAFIFAGINDAGVPRTTTQLRDDLRSMWTAARAAGAKVCAFTLPHRTSAGAWSQADWLTINTQIIADSSYYDFLVRTDIIFSVATSTDYTDNLHVNTAAHKKLASEVLKALGAQTIRPSLPADFVCNAVPSTTLSAGTRRNLQFTTLYDANSNVSAATVGSDANTTIFTASVDGTYEFKCRLCLSGFTSGDNAYLNGWITPLATGTEGEHRMDYQIAPGSIVTLKGEIRRRMLRGDKINMAVVSSRTSTTILTNSNNAEFSGRLVSIP